MRRFVVLLLVSTASLFASAQMSRGKALADVRRAPAAKKPDFGGLERDACYRLAVGNQRVRVFRVEVAPHASTQLNRHDSDYLIIALGDSRMKIAGGASEYALDLAEGEMQVMKGGWVHRVLNVADTPLRFIEVDVRSNIDPQNAFCGLANARCTDGHFGKIEPGSYSYSSLFDTATTRLRRVEIDAGVTVPNYKLSGNSLLLALSDLEISGEAFGDQPTLLRLNRGESFWYAGPLGLQLTNSGKQTARLLILELK